MSQFKRMKASLLAVVVGAGFLVYPIDPAAADTPLLADGTYRVTWTAKLDDHRTSSIDNGLGFTMTTSRRELAEYSGEAKVAYSNANPNPTTTMAVTKTHSPYSLHYEEHKIWRRSGGFYPCDKTRHVTRDINAIEPDKYFNVTSNTPMFRFQPFRTADGALQMHWPITSKPLDVVHLENDAVDPRFYPMHHVLHDTNFNELDCIDNPGSEDTTFQSSVMHWATTAPRVLTADPARSQTSTPYVTMGDLVASADGKSFSYDHTFNFPHGGPTNPSVSGSRIVEIHATVTPEATNQAPVVNAGPTMSGHSHESIALAGNVTDDGLPKPPGQTSATWSVVSGPSNGEVVFSDPQSPTTTAIFSRPGRYGLQLTASDSALSASASTFVDILDHYRVEMKTWIPFPTVVDPYAIDLPFSVPKVLLPGLAEPLRSCLAPAFGARSHPLTTVRVVSSAFLGDGHSDIGAFNSPTKDYRIRTFVEFDYDGTSILNFQTDTGVGATTRTISVTGPGGSKTCNQVGFADPAFSVRGEQVDSRRFTIGTYGYDPLVPKDVASWKAFCAPAAVTNSIYDRCLRALSQVPMTPSIDGHAQGSILADGSVSFTYTTDFFPSYGLAVKRNNEATWSGILNDASCADVSGSFGAANLLVRLQSNTINNVGALSSDTPVKPCSATTPLDSLIPGVQTALQLTVNRGTEPFLLIANSHLSD